MVVLRKFVELRKRTLHPLSILVNRTTGYFFRHQVDRRGRTLSHSIYSAHSLNRRINGGWLKIGNIVTNVQANFHYLCRHENSWLRFSLHYLDLLFVSVLPCRAAVDEHNQSIQAFRASFLSKSVTELLKY